MTILFPSIRLTDNMYLTMKCDSCSTSMEYDVLDLIYPGRTCNACGSDQLRLPAAQAYHRYNLNSDFVRALFICDGVQCQDPQMMSLRSCVENGAPQCAAHQKYAITTYSERKFVGLELRTEDVSIRWTCSFCGEHEWNEMDHSHGDYGRCYGCDEDAERTEVRSDDDIAQMHYDTTRVRIQCSDPQCAYTQVYTLEAYLNTKRRCPATTDPRRWPPFLSKTISTQGDTMAQHTAQASNIIVDFECQDCPDAEAPLLNDPNSHVTCAACGSADIVLIGAWVDGGPDIPTVEELIDVIYEHDGQQCQEPGRESIEAIISYPGGFECQHGYRATMTYTYEAE